MIVIKCRLNMNNRKKELYEPIHKVLRKRITPNGNVQYYVVWKNHRAKTYNTWINESDLTEVPIIKTFVHNGITYEYKCDSIESMYTFLKHKIMKNTQEMYKQVKNNMCKSKIFIIQDMPKYWTIINTRILYHAVVEVLVHNQPILCKLDNTNCMYIDEKD